MSKPQRVLSFSKGKALVDFDGLHRTVSSPVSLKTGEWVLCSAGIVARRITDKQAREMLREWRELNAW